MSKSDFLEELRMALASRVSPQEVTVHLRYYEEYIDTQVRMGKTESEVVAELGDPRLLARNIAESKKYASEQKAYGNNGKDNMRNSYDTVNDGYHTRERKRGSGWIIVLAVVVILFLIIGLIFSVLSFLAPVLIPLFIVLLLVRAFRKNT